MHSWITRYQEISHNLCGQHFQRYTDCDWIEKLDIKEFNKSRKVNGMFSTFARGKLQRKLMEALN